MALHLPSTDPQPLAAGLYRTDAFHRQPLFAVGSEVVRSWSEAHALHGDARPGDVNPAYVAALISGNNSAEAAPYIRIRRLPRAHHVLVGSDGVVHASAYDPLAGGATAMEPETLHQFLRQGLVDHVQQAVDGHRGAIGCEHSSGLDSNAVLGALVHGVGVAPERLHTWSQEGGGEGAPLQQFRPFHRLLPQQCHRFEPGDGEGEPGIDLLQQQLAVFGAPAQIGGNPRAVVLLRQQGCTVLFSGFGGDQAISHNAANVPSDLVALGRWRALLHWMGGRRAALKTAGGRALALSYRPWAVNKVLRRTRNFCSSDVLSRTLTPEGLTWVGPYLKSQYPWEIDGYLRQHHSIRRRVLADWVAVRAEDETRLAASQGMAKAFPLLDERLIAALLQQDPALFGEGAGRGRLLHRKAFAPFLPPFLRDNPTKDREPEGGLEQWRSELISKQHQALERSLKATSDWHPALARVWDLEAIRRETEDVLASSEPTMKGVMGTSRALATMAALSGWWQALDG
jgi:asparagine synthetase B (glutamine-hydrolysing)